MSYVLRMDMGQSFQKPFKNLSYWLLSKSLPLRKLFGNQVKQLGSFAVLHDKVEFFRIFIGFKVLDNIGMIQRSKDFNFLFH